MYLQYLLSGLASGCLIALMGLGFNLIYSSTGIFNLAHACSFLIAGYSGYSLSKMAGSTSAMVLLSAICLGTCFGLLSEWFVFRPLSRRKAGWNALFVASLGIYLIVTNLLAAVFGNAILTFRSGADHFFRIGEMVITRIQIAEIACLITSITILQVFLKFSSWGQGVRAYSDNDQLSCALGNNPHSTRTLVFLLASSLAAVAGLLSSVDIGVSPYMGLSVLLSSAVATMMAGSKMVLSTAFTGVLLGIVQALAVKAGSARFQDVVTFGVLILILALRPKGLFAARTRAERT